MIELASQRRVLVVNKEESMADARSSSSMSCSDTLLKKKPDTKAPCAIQYTWSGSTSEGNFYLKKKKAKQYFLESLGEQGQEGWEGARGVLRVGVESRCHGRDVTYVAVHIRGNSLSVALEKSMHFSV